MSLHTRNVVTLSMLVIYIFAYLHLLAGRRDPTLCSANGQMNSVSEKKVEIQNISIRFKIDMYKPKKQEKKKKNTEKVHVSKPSASSDQLHCMNMSCAKFIKTKEKKKKKHWH